MPQKLVRPWWSGSRALTSHDRDPTTRWQALEADGSWALIVQAIEDDQAEVSYASAIVATHDCT